MLAYSGMNSSKRAEGKESSKKFIEKYLRKGAWASSERENHVFGKFKPFIRATRLALSPPWLICLRTLPLSVQAPLGQDGS